jgi:tetratricopeptide (TPR) repeat protein
MARVATLLFCSLAIGCAEIRLARLKPSVEREVRAGRMRDVPIAEARLLEVADEAHGSKSVAATRERVTLARYYAQWELPDEALRLAHQTIEELDSTAPDQAIVPALLGLADIHLYFRQWKEAEQTTDRLVEICEAAPPHVPTADDGYDECHFAQYQIDDQYRRAGSYRKFADRYLRWDEARESARTRDDGLSMLSVLGRGYENYGAYPEATWYIRRCVDEYRPLYKHGDAPPPVRKVASTGDAEVFTMDWAHSFESQSPRCLEDLIRLQRLVGDDGEADELERWQRNLWAAGPDLEAPLVESMRKSDYMWHDGYNTSHDANNLAYYYANKGRTHDAIRLYKEAIALIDDYHAREGVFGGVLPTGMLLDELLGLGAEYEKAGLVSEAVAPYARATEVSRLKVHPQHARQLESRAGLARSLGLAGRREDATAAWKDYLQTAADIRGKDHPEYATGLLGLAAVTNDPREAKALRGRAEAIRAEARRRVQAVTGMPLPVALRSAPPPANKAAIESAPLERADCDEPPGPRPATRRLPWLRSRFAETPATFPATCRKSETPPPTSTSQAPTWRPSPNSRWPARRR